MRALIFSSVFAVLMSASSVASAAHPRAAALFDEGKKLLAHGHEAEGCAKLAESQRLEPAIGTRFHVASCDERAGRTASAFAGYVEVADAARARGQTAREKVARERAAALEPRVVRIVLDVAGSDTSDLTIQRNGTPVPRTEWNAATLIDPGSYTFEASRPGRDAFRTTIAIADGQRSVTVHIPELDPIAPPPADIGPAPPIEAPSAPPTGVSPLRVAALAGAGVGIVSIGLGAFFTVQALGAKADAEPHCRDTMCDPTGAAFRDDAVANGDRATIVFAAGTTLVVGSALLYYLAPRRSVEVGVGANAVSVRGTF